jgi:hypothetical protein
MHPVPHALCGQHVQHTDAVRLDLVQLQVNLAEPRVRAEPILAVDIRLQPLVKTMDMPAFIGWAEPVAKLLYKTHQCCHLAVDIRLWPLDGMAHFMDG